MGSRHRWFESIRVDLKIATVVPIKDKVSIIQLAIFFLKNRLLQELATLRKTDSKLPVNLFIDDSRSYKRERHSKRIKFQTNHDDKPNTRGSFSSMTLDGKVVEKTLPSRLEISQKDINKIRNFVLNNKDCLSLIADFDLEYDYFKQYLMIPGGEPATQE